VSVGELHQNESWGDDYLPILASGCTGSSALPAGRFEATSVKTLWAEQRQLLVEELKKHEA
jgi:hypothetical protein